MEILNITIDANSLAFSVFLGLAPIVFWLGFWLREDSSHPEPKSVLFLTFLAGMGAVLVALPLEYGFLYLEKKFGVDNTAYGFITLILAWSFIEEVLKYLAAQEASLKTRFFDEPIDGLVYLITAALGFAALENIFFLLKVVNVDGFVSGFITGNLRFVGASLLHVATSAIVGSSIAFSFYPPRRRLPNIIGSIGLATALHFAFNYFIIKADGANILKLFIPLWIIIIIIIFVFERVKKIKSNQ